MIDYHRKPTERERSVAQALGSAERRRTDLPQVVQVHDYDWDTVILADEIHKLRRDIEQLEEQIYKYENTKEKQCPNL